MAVDERGWHLYHASEIAAVGTVVNKLGSPHFQGEQLTALYGPLVGLPRLPFWYHREGDAAVVGAPGSSLWSDTNQYFERSPIDEAGEVTDWIWVRPDITAAAAAVYNPAVVDHPEKPFGFAAGQASVRDQLALRLLINATERGSLDQLELDEMLITLFGRLVDAAFQMRGMQPAKVRKSTRDAHRSAVNESVFLLSSNPAKRWTIDELARQVHLAPLHFCRIFKKLTGYTIREYQLQLRLANAITAIESGVGSIADAAAISGFSSGAHLSDALLGRTGFRPSDLQQSLEAITSDRMRSLLEIHAESQQ